MKPGDRLFTLRLFSEYLQNTQSEFFKASKEIRSAIVFGTAVVILLFLPLFALSGVEGSVQINLTLPPGSSLDASNQVSAVIDKKLQQMQKSDKNPKGAILHFVRRTGRAEMDEHASPVNTGEYILSMNPDILRVPDSSRLVLEV